MADSEAFLNDFVGKVSREPRSLARDIIIYNVFDWIENDHPGATKAFSAARELLSSEYARERFEGVMKGTRAKGGKAPLAVSGISRIAGCGRLEELPKVDIFRYLAARHPAK